MALSYSQKYAVFKDENFRGSVGFAIAKVGRDILNDGNANSSLAKHQKRHALAQGAQRFEEALVEDFAFVVVSAYPNDAVPLPDGDIEYLISVNWNLVAGVTPAEDAEV